MNSQRNVSKVRKAGCIVFYQNRILLVKQRSSGKWGFPKGTVKKGESLEDAAIRETLEETGIKLFKWDLYKRFRYSDSYYYLTVLRSSPLISLQLSELVDYKWVDPREVTLNTSIYASRIIKKLLCFMEERKTTFKILACNKLFS
jgi:8-oxo-dGTP pyrophosphatase MutT (NUDIX family)